MVDKSPDRRFTFIGPVCVWKQWIAVIAHLGHKHLKANFARNTAGICSSARHSGVTGWKTRSAWGKTPRDRKRRSSGNLHIVIHGSASLAAKDGECRWLRDKNGRRENCDGYREAAFRQKAANICRNAGHSRRAERVRSITRRRLASEEHPVSNNRHRIANR
jgi:hypothetical protein